ncbi:MAG: glycosyltransferase family 2 protein [Chthoniobacterales bacterium]
MTQPGPDIIVVIPIYNEEANIQKVALEWNTALASTGASFQILAINDGSRDGTAAVIDQLSAKIPAIRAIHKANSGHGRSCRHGYEMALREGARWIFQIDSDGQCDPSYFSEFWAQKDGHDCVFGFRSERGDGMGRKLIQICCRWATGFATLKDLKDPNVPYRLMRREVMEKAIAGIPADFNLQNIALTLRLFRQKEVRWKFIPIKFRPRQGGSNSINYLNIISLGWEMLGDLKRLRREP